MQFLNYYHCPRCETEWTDQWSAMCDDDCPSCGCRHISPYESEDVAADADADNPYACYCDNGHEQNDTVCMWCYNHGRRKWNDPEVQEMQR